MVPELHRHPPVEHVIGAVQRSEGGHAWTSVRTAPRLREQYVVEHLVVVLHSEIVRMATYHPLTCGFRNRNPISEWTAERK